ncbi:helix-turn-helix domain-containing protein [Parasedimentitalea maritima]|uniref:Helix-turn-helix domain-containing protein n=1 Tax=Parasedimentitalea maritima TaxID=2578117 RepID=A0A6A4RJJ8_9RHOB|nr:helix-turn-helix domain-containing protein [Zongyanglinia marina]
MACQLQYTPIADIAAQIGYFEPVNFTRFFKSQFGVTPNQFWKTKRQENNDK